MEGDEVRAALREITDVADRVVDHQMHVEEHAGDLPDRRDHRKTEGDVRDEIAVHHVDVQPFYALFLQKIHLLP